MSETKNGPNLATNQAPQEQTLVSNPLGIMKQALSERRIPQMNQTLPNTTVGGNALNTSSVVQSAASNHFMNFPSND